MFGSNPPRSQAGQSPAQNQPSRSDQRLAINKGFDFITFYVVLIAVVFAVAALGIWFFASSRNKAISEQESQISDYENQLKAGALKETEEKVKALDMQIKETKNLLDNVTIWSSFLDDLRRRMPKKSRFESISISSNQNLKISGNADDIWTVIDLLVSFRQNKLYTNTDLNSLTYNPKTLTYSFSVTVSFTNKSQKTSNK